MKCILFLLISVQLYSQSSFQSPSNPYYWKNKISEKSEYWQQDVDYTIDAYLDEKEEIIRGKETILYTNNSSHVLNELFVNLYQNAFIKNSYLSNLQTANHDHFQYGKWEADGKGNEILSLKINGVAAKTEVDGTILKVFLPSPILPNTTSKVEITFNTYYSKGGTTRRRMKSFLHQKERHFNGAHWYPRIAVYDRKFGWCTDQHLNRELYGDFGNYRVSLNMPANYVVDATGVLQNRKEVLPDTLRKKLDLSNYWTHRWDTAVSYHIPSKKGERKTWQYFAENVHDFAWIAGPHYRIDEKVNKGITTVAMVLEPHASGWKNACDYTHKVIECYSRDFGKYAYPKMIVADCYDGMEYPMLTMDGGADPGYRGLLAHEVGHNWFYGMVNNNETYRAMLDEGFTQFLTAWALEHIDGENLPGTPPTHPYLRKFYEPTKSREVRAYSAYMNDAMNHRATEINVHSDGFDGATNHGGGYRNVYYKTSSMLYNLQYVLGDSLFLNAMKNYFNQWSFRHPYVEDLRQSFIEYTKVDLNWFFDEWIETSKVIDYKIHTFKHLDSNRYQLHLKRLGDMQMPLDISIKGQSGKDYSYYVPNNWFEKKTNATVLPRWIGWDSKLQTDYTATLTLPEKPVEITIDPSKRLADINELNNTIPMPIQVKFDSKTERPIDRRNYTILWRPNIGYNNFDGIKLGVHTEGSYARTHHRIGLDFWINTTLGKWAIRPQNSPERMLDRNDWASFRFSYETPTTKLSPQSSIRIDARYLDGVALAAMRWSKQISNTLNIHLTGKSMLRYRQDKDNYNYFTAMQWNTNQYTNTSLQGEAIYTTAMARNVFQRTSLTLRSSILSLADYSYLAAEHKEAINWKKIQLQWRIYGRLGTSNSTYIPTESLLNAGGASGEEMLENGLMRSVSFFPDYFTPSSQNGFIQEFSHLHYGGGLNMRGYSFRMYATGDDGYIYPISNSNSGASINTEINFEKLSPIKFRKLARTLDIKTYLFGDIGTISNFDLNLFEMSKAPLLLDAGAGISASWKRFWVLSGLRPLTFRFDMPLYLSHPAIGDGGDRFQFRWLIGVEQAF